MVTYRLYSHIIKKYMQPLHFNKEIVKYRQNKEPLNTSILDKNFSEHFWKQYEINKNIDKNNKNNKNNKN